MNTKTKIPFGAGFFTGLLLGIGTVVGATEYDGNIEKVFQVSPGGKLIVQSVKAHPAIAIKVLYRQWKEADPKLPALASAKVLCAIKERNPR